MWRATLGFLIAFLGAVSFLEATAAGRSKVDELIALHDLNTSVSIGHYYLKQESLVSIREYLARVGREQNLGERWNASNPWWRQAEETLLEHLMADIDQEFASLEWLQPQWQKLYSSKFDDEQIDVLIAHFRTDVGSKQVMIIDHTVSTHVMMSLSFADKLKVVPGIEEERARMQTLWNDEDARMRFSIQDAANADGQAFALSPLGKRYFTTLILDLTGIVNQRLAEVAIQRPHAVESLAPTIHSYVEGFKRETM